MQIFIARDCSLELHNIDEDMHILFKKTRGNPDKFIGTFTPCREAFKIVVSMQISGIEKLAPVLHSYEIH